MRLIFKTKMLVYHSKADVDEKILFGWITHLENTKIRKIPVRVLKRRLFQEMKLASLSTVYQKLKKMTILIVFTSIVLAIRMS